MPLISIVIPCYNASNFIKETLQSILVQNEDRFEIIIVDDGSTDNSKQIIHSFSDTRIHYLFQTNQGVSASRNNGLKYAKGSYVIFFDADDIMAPDFIKSRVEFLEQDTNIDFVCGEVQKFDESGLIKGYYRGTSEKLVNEILFYNNEVHTCPSNYCFRKSFLVKNSILFNTILFSTADRFFLLQCSRFGKGVFHPQCSKLNYRVVKNSMSHLLTFKLVLDNEKYYQQMIRYKLIPENDRGKALFLGYYILFASYLKVDFKLKALKYALKCFFINPFKFVKKVFKNM